MIPYSQRADLYTVFNYSTNVIQRVGGEPVEGWGGENSKDREPHSGLPLFNLYGVELEVSTDYKINNIIDAFPEIFCIGKQDSSVSGSKRNAIEIVTIPATLRKHKSMWMHFFKNLNEDMFDCMDKHTNGMHVHVDRKVFQKDTLHLKKFAFFFANAANTEFLKEISERDNDSFNSYSKPRFADHAIRAEAALRSGDKHCIVNLGHSATVEVRLFKGIVSFASIVKNLEFVDSIVEYARDAKMDQMDLGQYVMWLNRLPRQQYRTLRLCINEMNLTEMMLKARYKSAVNTMAPRALEAFLNSAKLPENFDVTFIVKAFETKHGAQGWKISVDLASQLWIIVKAGTRFAKFNEQTLKMFDRQVRSRAA